MGDSKDGIGSDKEVDAMLSALLSKVNNVKGSLSSLVGKMEHEQLTWPSVLDSYSSFSGHMSNLMKQLGAERTPPLHTRVILPLMVSSEKDLELERQTEGRVLIMHHEVGEFIDQLIRGCQSCDDSRVEELVLGSCGYTSKTINEINQAK